MQNGTTFYDYLSGEKILNKMEEMQSCGLLILDIPRNKDEKVTLNELYKYASPPIFKRLVNQNYGKDNYPQAYSSNDNFILYQR